MEQQQVDNSGLVPRPQLPQSWLTLCHHVPATSVTGCPWPLSSPSAAWPAVTFCRVTTLGLYRSSGEATGKLGLGWGKYLSSCIPLLNLG